MCILKIVHKVIMMYSLEKCTYHAHVRALLTGMYDAHPLCRHYHYFLLSPDHTLPCILGPNSPPHPHPRPRPRPPPQYHVHYHDRALYPYQTQQPTKPIIPG